MKRNKDGAGYILVQLAEDDPYYKMTHHWDNYGDGWIPEHRYVMAKHLGRCLGGNEKVYRLNSKKDDNHIENLTLEMPPAQRVKAFRAIRAKNRRT